MGGKGDVYKLIVILFPLILLYMGLRWYLSFRILIIISAIPNEQDLFRQLIFAMIHGDRNNFQF